MGFTRLWALIEREKGSDIKNWTVSRGYLGDSFLLTKVTSQYVEVETPGASTIQHIPRKDFQTVLQDWGPYLSSDLLRHQLRDKTRFSKYIISNIRHVLHRP